MDKIDELLTRGVDKIYPSRNALEKVLRSGKKLRLYQGFDPTGIKLHIGHITGLMKLRQFQELGHNVIFLIGDGTGQAGDPSGKKRAREKFLSNKELRQNAKDYVMQAGKIVKFSGPNSAEILYNSDWLNKLTLIDILNIAGHFSLQQLEERDMFIERKKRGESVNMREFLYPLLQGYDSVAMKVDLELGGSDQTFNMLCGRTLVSEMLHKNKFVMTTPLLADSSGNKIGKTEGNVIALTAIPPDLYGMIMSLPDEIIVKSFEVLTTIPFIEIAQIEKAIKSGNNPMIYKKKLAFTITEMLNSTFEAQKAEVFFQKVVQNKETPDYLEQIVLYRKNMNLVEFLTTNKLIESKSKARRLIEGGGVEVNNKKITDFASIISFNNGTILKIGKRNYYQISIKK